MDLYGFNFHNYEKRQALVYEYGCFMCCRQEEDYRIALYNMGSFFAEIWYDSAKNKIELVRGFKSKAALDPYLELVDLDKLLA